MPEAASERGRASLGRGRRQLPPLHILADTSAAETCPPSLRREALCEPRAAGSLRLWGPEIIKLSYFLGVQA